MGGVRVQIPRKQFGLICSKLNPLSWTNAFNPNLHLGSPNHDLSLSLSFELFFFGDLNQFIFPPKWCHVGLALICHFLVFDPRLEALWVQFMALNQ